jgi:NlpC/P60 family putative phage cell wall peptidase
VSAAAIIASARGWVGTPFVHGASLKGVGCDCLGLLRGVWREVIGPEPEPVPAYGGDWSEPAGAEVLAAMLSRHFTPLDAASRLPGTVLLLRWRDHLPARHAAILTAPGLMVHAHAGAGVCEVALGPWWARHVAAAFAFPLTNEV